MNYIGRKLLVAPRDFYIVQRKFPRRVLESSAYTPEGFVFYANPRGRVRMLRLSTGVIYECDWELGPYFMKPLNRVKPDVPDHGEFARLMNEHLTSEDWERLSKLSRFGGPR
jgi:hypothetical protein